VLKDKTKASSMRRFLVLTLLAGLLLASPAAARTYRVDVPDAVRKQVREAKPDLTVPILLPSRMPSERRRLYGSGGGSGGSYAFGLANVPNCGGANACSVATFSGTRGGRATGRSRVALTGGLVGRFTPLQCGASCAPPSIEWVSSGVLYAIQADVGPERVEKRRLVRMADSAIRNGPR
jgi:hypothetical protein